MKKLFSRENLVALKLGKGINGLEHIETSGKPNAENEIVVRQIFTYKGKYYATHYVGRVGYPKEPEMIPCVEMVKGVCYIVKGEF